jgi:hypothetical protein
VPAWLILVRWLCGTSGFSSGALHMTGLCPRCWGSQFRGVLPKRNTPTRTAAQPQVHRTQYPNWKSRTHIQSATAQRHNCGGGRNCNLSPPRRQVSSTPYTAAQSPPGVAEWQIAEHSARENGMENGINVATPLFLGTRGTLLKDVNYIT